METTEVQQKFIDLDKIIQSKNPRLYRLLPRFLINRLKKIVHQEEVNDVIWRNRDKYGLDFANAVIEEFKAQIKVNGIENVPPTGNYIIAANHPLGGLDGVALMTVVGKIRSDIVFPVNDLLLNLKNFAPLFIPINKHGSNRSNINILEENFASDKAILFFPAGLVSRKQKGKILDLEWKKSFISKARKYNRDIIPAHIDGNNSNFFYNLANIRKKLGIKANIEMLFLVDEMFKQKNKTITITFGKKISISTLDKSRSDEEWAKLLKNHVYNLPNGVVDFQFS